MSQSDSQEPTPTIKFRKYLRQIFGGRSHAERLRLFRKFLNQHWGDDKKADEWIVKFNSEGVTLLWRSFKDAHIHEWRKANRLQQRRDAAKKRWQKAKAKKSL